MTALPTGTVTFLFTDIEGSTRLLHELGAEQYAAVLGEHRRVLRIAFEAHRGVEVDKQGDAFFVAFQDAKDASAAALDAQRSLASGPISVRMGIHTGEPIRTEEAYVGIDVHRGARVCAAAHGGQIILSDRARGQIDLAVLDLGLHRLKDLSEPQRLFQLGDDVFPPLRTLYATNLPVQPSPLVGRERELAEVSPLLDRHQVLTLTGAGGSGKTRLALQLAAESIEAFKDGVWWVPLQALRDPELVLPAISQTLGAKDELADYVAAKQMLLLLDNLEQLVAAAPAISELLSSSPNLKLLVTSRGPMRIAGECEYAVEPLAEEDAVALFRERAFQSEPADAVAEICRRVDGLPLAVELAAARTRVLSPNDLLERLESRLPLLVGGRRDAPERQRTLRATIEWSYDLLGPSEQHLFSSLAAFAGGFTVEAAEEVCDADLDALESLVEESLVRRTGDRFSMLETIREYALERTQESGEYEQLCARHLSYAVRLAEEGNLLLRGPEQASGLDRLEAEHDNFRAALSWALDGADVARGQELAAALAWFWQLRSHLGEGESWIEAALARGEHSPAVRAKLLQGAGQLSYYKGEGELLSAEAFLEEAVVTWRGIGDRLSLAQSLAYLGIAAGHAGHTSLTRRTGEEAVAFARGVGEAWTLGLALWGLGTNIVLGRCEPVESGEARLLLEESVALLRGVGDPWALGAPLLYLGLIEEREGKLAAAVELVEESVSLFRQARDKWRLLRALAQLSELVERQGDQARARRLLEEAEALEQEVGRLTAAPPESARAGVGP